MTHDFDNPALRAAIAERASIDGDVPEFRQGPPPVEGFRPAVPVVTDSLNPVQVGLMLERASREIESRFQLANETALVLANGDTQLVASVPGYPVGDVPEPMEVESPSAAVLSSIPDDKARYFVWLSIATTQGRRSLAPAIQAELERRLGVSAGNCDKNSRLHADARWLLSIFGPDDLLEDFSPIESAVSFFEDILRQRLPCAFMVLPLAQIPERRFGWLLRTSKL